MLHTSQDFVQESNDLVDRMEEVWKTASPVKSPVLSPPTTDKLVLLPPLIDFQNNPNAYSQLVFLHESLSRMHQNNPNMFPVLLDSHHLILAGNFPAAASLLATILHSPYFPPHVVHFHQSIEQQLKGGHFSQ